MRRFRKATIKDVAEHAGVSTTTVSVFVSGREDVCSPSTGERIRAAVAELNYTPSSLVSSVQNRATGTIGVCMFSPVDPHVQFAYQFYERMWRGIVVETDEADRSILLYPASVRNSARSDIFLDGRIDGLLYHGHSGDNARPERVGAAGMPTVLLTRSRSIPADCGAAWADEADTASLALSHLWEMGHRRIAHLAGPAGIGREHDRITSGADIAICRLEAYTAWMNERNAYDPDLIGYAFGWVDSPYIADAIERWMNLSHPPTAVFCANDALALCVMQVAQARGLRIPEDLSLVGVDNSIAGLESVIPLTTVDVPVEGIGQAAVKALIRIIEGAPVADCRIPVPVTDIIVRQSSAPPAVPPDHP